LQAAPWLDLLFVLFFLAWAQSRIVLQPGVVISLPLHGGSGVVSGLTAVLVPGPREVDRSAILYFDDEAFALHDPARVQDLKESLQRAHQDQPLEEITLYADSRVTHAFVVQVMDMIADVGFDQLNIGTSPQTSETGTP
jgi:biopolymer transport protein ExbD